MRRLLLITSLVLLTAQAYALYPVPGYYGGIFLGPSTTSDMTTFFRDPNDNDIRKKGNVRHNGFGDIGGELGYRFKCWLFLRAELEGFYNHSPYKQLTSGPVTFTSQKVASGKTYISGSTRVAAGMINGYFDFFPFTGYETDFVPYLAVGVGFANMRNHLEFIRDNKAILDTRIATNKSSAAGQAIFGANYFLDNYTAVALDYRYFVAGKVHPHITNTQIHSVNVTFNGVISF